ncbi:MAG: nitroreductase family protein [Eubacterium sp.]|nr:nitroreductase family protein [Eubacterium sp.]
MFTASDNQALDNIMKSRRICRKFTDQVPDKKDVEAVVTAGRMAPYASISSGDVDVFRHFYVIFRDNPLLEKIDKLIKDQTILDLAILKEEMAEDKFLQKYGVALEKMWFNVAENGLPVFPNPPCLIVLAEWRGARRAERQSLAHTIQNMWLKATALNLDFNMISPLESMWDNQEFCDLFGLPVGKYGFHGCIIGYKEAERLTSKPISDQVHWL